MLPKPALIAFIITVKVLTIISVFYEYDLTAEEIFKHILILMLGITILTISATFICLIKLRYVLQNKKKLNNLYFIEENFPLTTQTALIREPSQESLEPVPSYNKAISSTVAVNINTYLNQSSFPPPPYTSSELPFNELKSNFPPNYDDLNQQ